MNPVNSVVNQAAKVPSLVEHIDTVFIIAYKESTEQLEAAFAQEGFRCEVLRQEQNENFQGYSPSFLCLMNHRRAWERAIQDGKPTLVVEADFVPVVGFGQRPLPFNPAQPDVGITWLYTCAPQVYSVTALGHAEGYSTSMVAYIVTVAAAKGLVELSEQIRDTVGPQAYSAWDSGAESFLRDRGLKSYIAFRNYGEHGGRPNPEHHQHGLSKVHRADVLYGKLAFSPLYATGESFFQARLKARAKGMARLLAGKFLRTKVVRESSVPLRILSFAIRRQLYVRF